MKSTNQLILTDGTSAFDLASCYENHHEAIIIEYPSKKTTAQCSQGNSTRCSMTVLQSLLLLAITTAGSLFFILI